MANIDKERLKELAENPRLTGAAILKALGFNNYATFSYQLNKDPELRRVFDDGREAAAKAKSESPMKVSARRPATQETAEVAADSGPTEPRRKYKARRASKKKANPPPRKKNAKQPSPELFRRLQLEFDHIDVYGATSEHFEDLKAELTAAV